MTFVVAGARASVAASSTWLQNRLSYPRMDLSRVADTLRQFAACTARVNVRQGPRGRFGVDHRGQ